jgi:AAA family ATP:ADP antiporter
VRWLVELRQGERRPTLAAFFVLLGVMAAHTMLETARDALFLARLPASRLPWVYIAVAALGLLLARAGQRGSGARGRFAVSGTLLGAAAITAGFWAASTLRAEAFLYALYLWSGVFAAWVILQLWLVLGATFTVSQAKRLFGFIGAGSVLGAVAGAAAAAALTRSFSARHLLAVGAGVLAATALGPAALLRSPPSSAPRAGARTSFRADLRDVAAHPYVRRILVLVLVATVTVTCVDYLFKAAVAERISKDALGSFFATVYTVLNAIAFVVQIGAVSLLLRLLGVQRTVLIMPALVLLGAGGVALGGGLAAVVLLKGADGALRHSLHRTATELLFVPVPDALRARAKPVIDLLGQRCGQALASLGILGLVALVPARATEAVLALVIVALAAGWVAVAFGIERHYLDLFRENLRQGRLDYEGDLPELDLRALEALMAGLNSHKDAEVLGALDLLAAQRRERLIPALLLYHPSRNVVLKTLALFAAEKRNDFVPIAQRLLAHPEPEVRAAALRARAAVEPDEAFLRARLADDCLEVRATALVTLLGRGWLAGAEGADALAQLVGDPSAAVRIALARAIGEQPDERLWPTLEQLIAAREPEVQMETAWAMGRTRDARFVPALLGLLGERLQGSAAREALAAIGPPALAALEQALTDPELDRVLRANVPRAIALFPPRIAAPILSRHLLGARGGLLRFRVLRALCRLRVIDPELEIDAGAIAAATEAAVRSAVRNLAWRVTLERGAAAVPARDTPARRLIAALLQDKEAHAMGRVFRLLGLAHPRENFERIQRGLHKNDPKTRASSRELVENLVAPPLRVALLALIDDLSDAERLDRTPASYRPAELGYDALLALLVERGKEVGALAAHHAAEIGVARAARPTDAARLSLALEAHARGRGEVSDAR